MPYNNQHLLHSRHWPQWRRFLIGVICLTGAVFFFTRGPTPPGVLGEVIRHNQAAAIDAASLVPYDVENIVEIQAGLTEWWEKPDTSISSIRHTQAASIPVSR